MKMLIVGRNATGITEAAVVFNRHGIDTTGVTDIDECHTLLAGGGYTTLVIGAGIDPDTRKALHTTATEHGIEVIDATPGDLPIPVYMTEVLIPQLLERKTGRAG